ncbi:MAG: aminofutalosine synthase MqnE [Gaiellaceae bacterium]|jgi:aminodeoxyfutalosine synthase
MSLAAPTGSAALELVQEKLESGERLDSADGLALLESSDLLALAELAERARRLRGGGDEAYFVRNLTLNQTNVCRVKCKFCAFARSPRQEGAYTLSPAELVDEAARAFELSPFNELHLVNGESPQVDFDWYLETMRALREALPGVHLKCYSASEIHHMHTLSGLSYAEVLGELKQAGLGSLTGGGAEIFSPRVRKLIAPGKEPAENWLEVNRVAHSLGVPSHCTILYGHIETTEERVEHLLRLRELQDETGGFLAFVPLAVHLDNTRLDLDDGFGPSGADDLKMIAVSRLLLDNVPHIKAYWISIGLPLAQVALHFGADDVQGTVGREQVFHAAGAHTETEQGVDRLVRFIQAAGRVPVERDTLYNELRRWE